MARWSLPKPFADELFSGWLVRSALTLGCDPLVLTGELWPKWRAWTLDIDRGIGIKKLSILEARTGIDQSVFQSMLLKPTAVKISGVSELSNAAIWPWMMSLGSRNRKRHGGLQYCPRCFEKDSRPYYRLRWRYAWHCGCPDHGCLLQDRCHQCQAPLEPHRLDSYDHDLAVCARCRVDLAVADSATIDSRSLDFQRTADRVLLDQEGPFGAVNVPSAAWFELCRFFVTLLRKSSLGNSQKLTFFIELLGVDKGTIPLLKTGLSLEMLPVEERIQLLIGVWTMLQAGPDGFAAAVKQSSVGLETLHDRRFPFPSALREIYSELPLVGHVVKNESVSGSQYNPRSRQAVMRSLARLRRKYYSEQP